MVVTVRYFAAARAAAGVTEETVALPAAGPETGTGTGTARPTVGAVVAAAAERRPGLARVLPRCSFLLDEVAVHEPDTPVRPGQVLDVLPPFAGG
ncbi:MoaD/ThiS family protein [Nakamurella sp.]|uniref:MoaD/ThiS family protein n=1 Tax=Nakamurella sp. TaxID=1869182 RepID=UPI003B3BCE6B